MLFSIMFLKLKRILPLFLNTTKKWGNHLTQPKFLFSTSMRILLKVT